jgi:DNA-binding transcriptional MerR regulator
LLRIGQFAHHAGVSVKTLRYYASIGLLSPAYVDSTSRYRYFHRAQLHALAQIRALRDTGFTIREVQRWMDAEDAPGERTAILEAVRNRIAQRLADDRRRLQSLRRLLHESGIPAQQSIRISNGRHLIPEPAYTIRDRVRSIRGSVYRMFELAEQVVARNNARSTRRPFLLLHDPLYSHKHADVEICVPIVGASISALGGRWVEGAKRAVCERCWGSYAHGPVILKSIASWMRQEDLHQVGPVRETYLRYGADQRGYRLPRSHLADSVAEYRTELQVPVT